jgi:sulfopyruvate decarboxylase TPP-binding subunit
MPESIRAADLLSALIRAGVTHLIGLPDNTSAALFSSAEEHDEMTVLTVTREGEAFAIASGLWLGGKSPVVVVQNTGLLESGDSLRGTAVRMGVPLLCIVTYRGYGSMMAAATEIAVRGSSVDTLTRNDVDSAALVTEPTLRAWGIPYRTYNAETRPELLVEAWNESKRDGRPVVVLLTHALA